MKKSGELEVVGVFSQTVPLRLCPFCLNDHVFLQVSEMDIAHMARTLLLHCVREYRGDERIRQTVWQMIAPQGAKNAKEAKGAQSIYHQVRSW